MQTRTLTHINAILECTLIQVHSLIFCLSPPKGAAVCLAQSPAALQLAGDLVPQSAIVLSCGWGKPNVLIKNIDFRGLGYIS